MVYYCPNAMAMACTMGKVLNGKYAQGGGVNYTLQDLLVPEYPSCLQATRASKELQKSSHTVPHMLKRHISTRPRSGLVPPTSLMLPWLQGAV